MADERVQTAIDGELQLLEAHVRASSELLEAVLDPEFSEIGASGTRWSRAAIIAALTGVLLAPWLVHLTFTTSAGGRRVHRSSLWRRSGDRWQIYFHQATPAPEV
ncbi:MAG TPA: nuclear transport factor 2 family protein [Gaiellales bacterium]